MNMVAMPSDGFYLLEVCGEEGWVGADSHVSVLLGCRSGDEKKNVTAGVECKLCKHVTCNKFSSYHKVRFH